MRRPNSRSVFSRSRDLVSLLASLLSLTLCLISAGPLRAAEFPMDELARFLPGRFPQTGLPEQEAVDPTPIRAGAGSNELTQLGAWPFGPAFYTDYDEVRDLLFYGTGAAVRVLDLSTPSDPVLVSDTVQGQGRVRAICYESNTELLYLAEEEMGMEIWDLSDPVNPVRLSTTQVVVANYVAPVVDVEVADGFAHIAASYGFFHVYDVRDPSNPTFVEGWQISNALDVVIRGSQVVVIGNDVALFQRLGNGHLNPLTANTSVNARAGTVLGNYAYVIRNGNILVLNLTILFLPIVGNYQDPDIYLSDVVQHGPYLYTTGTAGIRVLEVSDPTAPSAVGANERGASTLEAKGTRLYATAGSAAFWMDLTVPTDPVEVGEDEAPAASCYDVDVQGSYAYAAESSKGLYVLDVSDPASPVEVGRTEIPELALDVALDGSYAYIAAQFAGLQIVDISDPANPAVIGAHPTPYYARGVAISGSHAYVGDLSGGLIIFDVSDPAAPVQVGQLTFPDGASGVTVDGELAYCAGEAGGLQIVDVSDPTAPTLIGQLGGLDYTVSVSLTGDLAVLADFGGGMRVVDVSTPSNPILLSTFEPTPSAVVWGIDTEGSLALASTAEHGIYLLDLSDPSQPLLLDDTLSAGDAFEPWMEGGRLHLADGATGVAIYQYIDPASAPDAAGGFASEVLAWSRGGDTAVFDLPAGVRTLDIYDLSGRRVSGERLQAGPGRQRLEFAAKHSGVYFWKARGTGLSETGRVVLVR